MRYIRAHTPVRKLKTNVLSHMETSFTYYQYMLPYYEDHNFAAFACTLFKHKIYNLKYVFGVILSHKKTLASDFSMRNQEITIATEIFVLSS